MNELERHRFIQLHLSPEKCQVKAVPQPRNPFSETRAFTNRTSAGFSLVEVLVVLTVIALLAGIGVSTLPGLRKQLTLEEAAQTVSQDIQKARAYSLSSNKCTSVSSCWRLRVTGPRSYVVEELATTWQTRESRQFPKALAIAGATPGDAILFDTRGFATFSFAAKTAEVRVSDGAVTLRIIPSIVGATKVVKL